MDFSNLLGGLNVSSGVAAIMGAAALMLAVGFATWLTDTIAQWFESHDDSDNEDDEIPWEELHWSEVECLECGFQFGSEDAFVHAVNQGYCPKCGE